MQYTLYGQDYWDTPNYWTEVFQSDPLPEVYKIKHLAMQSATQPRNRQPHKVTEWGHRLLRRMVHNSHQLSADSIVKVKVKWHTYSEFVLLPIQSAHTHTVNTHPEQWAAIYAAVPGEQLGVRCLAQGHLSRGIEGRERALYIHSPHLQSLPARDSNSQPLDYESDSLTIRPRLPRRWTAPNFHSH